MTSPRVGAARGGGEMSGCSAKTWSGFSQYPCSRSGKVKRDGKIYCGIHDPVAKKERQERSSEKNRARWAEERKRHQEERDAAFLRECERRAGASAQAMRLNCGVFKTNGAGKETAAELAIRWLDAILGGKP